MRKRRFNSSHAFKRLTSDDGEPSPLGSAGPISDSKRLGGKFAEFFPHSVLDRPSQAETDSPAPAGASYSSAGA